MNIDDILLVQSPTVDGTTSSYVLWEPVSHKEAMDLRLAGYMIADASYRKMRYGDDGTLFVKKNKDSYSVIIYGHIDNTDERGRKIQFSYFSSSISEFDKALSVLCANMQRLGYKVPLDFKNNIKESLCEDNKKSHNRIWEIFSLIGTIIRALILKILKINK